MPPVLLVQDKPEYQQQLENLNEKKNRLLDAITQNAPRYSPEIPEKKPLRWWEKWMS